ncbi:hypothetical protein J7L70_02920 [Candidatus Bathyarchaeota archaeon]|nr:hypothetical protein [Candidatus Bathyarchaeota archaeon]
MKGKLLVVTIIIFIVLLATNLDATSQITLRNRSAVIPISDKHALLYVEIRHVRIFQTSGEICILKITNRTPERLTINVDATKAGLTKSLKVHPYCIPSKGEAEVILHYDASCIDPGTYDFRLTIKVCSKNLKIILYRRVQVTVEKGVW